MSTILTERSRDDYVAVMERGVGAGGHRLTLTHTKQSRHRRRRELVNTKFESSLVAARSLRSFVVKLVAVS